MCGRHKAERRGTSNDVNHRGLVKVEDEKIFDRWRWLMVLVERQFQMPRRTDEPKKATVVTIVLLEPSKPFEP